MVKKILVQVKIKINDRFCFIGDESSNPCNFNGRIEYAQGNSMHDPPVEYLERGYCSLFMKKLKKTKDGSPIRCVECSRANEVK
jgi:hypothetical protein